MGSFGDVGKLDVLIFPLELCFPVVFFQMTFYFILKKSKRVPYNFLSYNPKTLGPLSLLLCRCLPTGPNPFTLILPQGKPFLLIPWDNRTNFNKVKDTSLGEISRGLDSLVDDVRYHNVNTHYFFLPIQTGNLFRHFVRLSYGCTVLT